MLRRRHTPNVLDKINDILAEVNITDAEIGKEKVLFIKIATVVIVIVIVVVVVVIVVVFSCKMRQLL